MKTFLAAIVLLAFASAPGWGAIIPSLSLVDGSGPFTFFYTLDQAAGTVLDPVENEAQVVVIYDFEFPAGDISDPTLFGSFSGNWVVTSTRTGPVRLGTADPSAPFSTFPTARDVEDDPSIPNLIFTYNGPRQEAPTGRQDFDIIFATSELNTVGQSSFRGQGTKLVPPPDPANENDTAAGTVGRVGVAWLMVEPPVPEPASYALLGSGLAGIALFRRKRGQAPLLPDFPRYAATVRCNQPLRRRVRRLA